MIFQHSIDISHIMPINNITVHENIIKNIYSYNVGKTVGYMRYANASMVEFPKEKWHT